MTRLFRLSPVPGRLTRPAIVLALWACLIQGRAVLAQATSNPPVAQPQSATGAEKARTLDAAGNVTGPLRAGWWNDAVFYEIFVRSFADARTEPSDGKGPKADDGVGDLRGLIERLDYLNDGDPETGSDLGITALWLMPISPSPSYHGYDITDYSDINPDYGTREDFYALVRECHKRGIRVVVDLVLNHTSDRHPWFTQARDPKDPHHDWYIWTDHGPGDKGLWGQQVWHKLKGTESAWYFGMFSGQMPDLNMRNAGASRAMLDVSAYWVKDIKIGTREGMGADGVRLDAIRHLIEDGPIHENTPATHEWLKEFRGVIKRAKPEAFSIGEVWTSSAIASSYVGDELDAVFEFDLSFAMIRAAKAGRAEPVVKAQAEVLRRYPPGQYGRFLTNHDQKRVMSELEDDAGAMRVAAAMLLTGPGIPFIYYGEELGILGDKPDPELRLPMPWDEHTPNHGFSRAKPWKGLPEHADERNVRLESASPGSLLSLYRGLIRARNSSEALRSGRLVPVTASDPGVYAFIRTSAPGGGIAPASSDGGAQSVLVVINLSAASVKTCELRVEPGLGKFTTRPEVVFADGYGPPDAPAQEGWSGRIPGFDFDEARGVFRLKADRPLEARSTMVLRLGAAAAQ